ncbi:MAG: pentapeptide repeat-containing protein [bacterium]|nr:pentapeptide repeat-containing protein [bacterium]
MNVDNEPSPRHENKKPESGNDHQSLRPSEPAKQGTDSSWNGFEFVAGVVVTLTVGISLSFLDFTWLSEQLVALSAISLSLLLLAASAALFIRLFRKSLLKAIGLRGDARLSSALQEMGKLTRIVMHRSEISPEQIDHSVREITGTVISWYTWTIVLRRSIYIVLALFGGFGALIGASLLAQQNKHFIEQNEKIQNQIEVAAQDSRFTRRTQLLQLIYEGWADVDGQSCQKTPLPLRETAIMELIVIEEELRLYQVELRRADLSGLRLTKAHLNGAKLEEAKLHGADLRDADLRDAHLQGAFLQQADLTRARMDGAKLIGARADEGTVMRSVFLRRADLSESSLTGVDLSGGSILEDAILKEADLLEANLSGATLFGADLSGALLFGANLNGADLREANLSGAKLVAADLKGVTFLGANLVESILDGADMTGVRGLTQKQLDSACGDLHTKLPEDPNLKRPNHWTNATRSPFEQRKCTIAESSRE